MAPGRRGRDAKHGQIPLSSGEIELYSRQDEAARRRQRLLAVRDQERRLAQQVTQRYRQNLQQLQQRNSRRTRAQLSVTQQVQLTQLHRRYQNSLQSMGTAQRNARAKLLELMEQAQQEQGKWVHNRRITDREREEEAQEEREEEEKERNARRRRVEQNMQRLKQVSSQQRRQASARARQEQDVAMQRVQEREEVERRRRRQSREEVFVTPRPHEKDVVSYRFKRTHCFQPEESVGKEKVVTVIKHNRKHPTAVRGEDEAEKHRERVDQKRERDRRVAEEQQETAAERGTNALDDVTSKQQGQQALEWLALVDKMERRVRGQEMGGDDSFLDAGEADGDNDRDPQRMAERTFAQMLGLDEVSVELSAFSIETDDESVGLADADREQKDNDEIVEANAECRAKLQDIKRGGSLDLLGEKEFGQVGKKYRDGRAESTHANAEKPLKATSFGKDGHQKFQEPKNMQTDGLSFKGEPVKPRGGVTGRHNEDAPGKRTKGPLENGGDDTVSGPSPVRWDQHRNNRSTTESQHRLSYGSIEERPEGTDNEDDEVYPLSHETEREHESVERLEDRLQEVLDFRFTRPRRDQPLTSREPADEQESFLSGSESGQRFGQIDDADADVSRTSGASGPPRNNFSASDSRNMSSSGRSEAMLVEHHALLLSSESDSSEEEFSQKPSALEDKLSRAVTVDNDSVSASFAPSQKSVSRFDQVAEDRAMSLGQRFVDRQDMLSVSSSERQSHDEVELDSLIEEESGRVGTKYSGQPEATHDKTDESLEAASFVADELQGFEKPKNRKNMQKSGLPAEGSPVNPRGRMASSDYEDTSAAAGRSEAMLIEHDDLLSSSESDFFEDKFRQNPSTRDDNPSRVVAVDEDSVSESSIAPSQMYISRLNQVAKDRAMSLGQRFVDRHELSFSSSERRSGDERESEGDLSRSSIGSDKALPSVNINPYDPYRLQIDRRSSSSAVSVAQYSLPPSDTKTSFDDSLDQLHPGYGDDSFVNELVPMFPKRALPQPPRSFDEDSQALEEYDVQLVAPNVSRMLTSDGRTSFGRSRQYLVHQDHQEAAAINPSRQGRREAPLRGERQRDMTAGADEDSVSERSYASSSSMSMDAHFNYLASMTSAVGKSLPLHLRLPVAIYGKKDMTKPPAPIAWSVSSVSSIDGASEVDPSEIGERGIRPDKRISRSQSSASESLLEEQQVTPPRRGPTQRNVGWKVRGSDSHESSAGDHLNKALDESSYSKSTEDGAEKGERLTFRDIKEKIAMLPPPPVGSLDMRQPPAPLQRLDYSSLGSHSSSEQSFEGHRQSSGRRQVRRPDEEDDERKSDDSSSDGAVSSHGDNSSSSSFASSRRQDTKKAEKIVIPVRSSNDDDDDESTKEISLAEAFKRRHPGFGHHAETHRLQHKRQQEPERDGPAERSTRSSEATAPSPRGHVATPLPPEQQELLDRLATGSRAKISSREMKERSRRLYHQLPEVVERKRQEEVMRRRRERLAELREQEKERRLQQKQRRQQPR